MTVDPAVLKVADAVGALIENWGFKRNMGRMWVVLYLEDHALTAAELGDRLGLSTGAVSMLLTEMQQWGVIKKAWVVGERREHYEAETSSGSWCPGCCATASCTWIRTAHEEFERAGVEYEATTDRRALIAERITGLTQLAQVGQHLLESVLQGDAVETLPLKTVGELVKATRGQDHD